MFSPLSVTREREKTDEGEAQTETEAPERPQNQIASLLDIKEDRERKERARASQRSPEKTEEGDAQTEAPERPQSLISSLLRVTGDRERKEGARASQRSPGGQRRERLRRKLRRGPGVGWDWFSNSFPLVFLAEPIREPKQQ